MLSIDAWLDEKPYKELYDCVVHEKVSPRTEHGQIEGKMWALLAAWGEQSGVVATELRVYLREGTTLVPDVAYISKRRLSRLTREERQKPPFAPDIAVEVKSPDDRESNIARKTQLYLEYGSTIVLNIDPDERTVYMTDERGEKKFLSGEVVEHHAFPELRLPVDAIFASLD